MEKEGRKQRKTWTVEAIDTPISKLAERRKKLQLARHIALGRLVEKHSKEGFVQFDQALFFAEVTNIVNGVNE